MVLPARMPELRLVQGDLSILSTGIVLPSSLPPPPPLLLSLICMDVRCALRFERKQQLLTQVWGAGLAGIRSASSKQQFQSSQTASLLQPQDTATSPALGSPAVGALSGTTPPYPTSSAATTPSHLEAPHTSSLGLGAIGQMPPSLAPGGATSASATAPIGPPSRTAAVGSETSQQRVPSSSSLGGVQVCQACSLPRIPTSPSHTLSCLCLQAAHSESQHMIVYRMQHRHAAIAVQIAALCIGLYKT